MSVSESITATENRPRRRRFFGWYPRTLLNLVLLAWALAFLVGIAGAIFAFLVYDHITAPGVPGPALRVEIPDGATGLDVGEQLVAAGLVEHPFFFRVALQLDGDSGVIRSGIYNLPRGLAAREYLALLHRGPDRQLRSHQVRITIPEGLTIAQIAAREEVTDPKGFLEAARDPARIQALGITAPSLEGFLMPNTYYFDEAPTGAELVDTMLEQFQVEYARILRDNPGAASFDKLTIVTVASLIEEEARVDDERPLVAAVIYNRLEEKMHLGMDSTLQFALDKYGQRLLDVDKQVDSPYNTYRNRGLPPGPISNPGAASIRAAMNPAPVEYLYFVSNADGKTHTFSKTQREHDAAVAKYRREIAEQRAALERQQQELGQSTAGE